MKLTAFRIENYRCIQDSGWIEVDDVAVVVGKNESGKTSLLKALWKFHPFHDVKYDLDREWPRGRRKDKSPEKVVATVRFEFTPAEISEIESIHESAKGIQGVEIKKNYKGAYLYTFLPKDPNGDHDIAWVISLLEDKLGKPPEPSSDHFKNQYRPALAALIDEVREKGGSRHALITARHPPMSCIWESFICGLFRNFNSIAGIRLIRWAISACGLIDLARWSRVILRICSGRACDDLQLLMMFRACCNSA